MGFRGKKKAVNNRRAEDRKKFLFDIQTRQVIKKILVWIFKSVKQV